MQADEETNSTLPEFFAEGTAALARQEYEQALNIFKDGLINEYVHRSESGDKKLWFAFYATVELLEHQLRKAYGESWERKIPKLEITSRDLACSFCGKRQLEVVQLIAGANAYICDGCVTTCNEILAERQQDQA